MPTSKTELKTAATTATKAAALATIKATSKATAKPSAGPKTVPTPVPVAEFLDRTATGARRSDCAALVALMQQITGVTPTMWGTSIVGFGRYHYVYASGRSGDAPVVGFSPRKTELVVYLIPGFEPLAAQVAALGPHRRGVSCLYLKRLADVDMGVLQQMIEQSVAAMESKRVK